MKTWKQLEDMARRRRLVCHHARDVAWIDRAAGDRATLISIKVCPDLAQDDSERLLRAMTEAALRELADKKGPTR